MAIDPKRLLALDSRVDELVSALARQYQAAVSAALDQWAGQVRREVSKLPTGRSGQLLRGRGPISSAARSISRLAGRLDLPASRALATVPQLTSPAIDGMRLAGFDVRLSAIQRRALITLLRRRQYEMEQSFISLSNRAVDVLYRGSSSGQLLSEVLFEIQELVQDFIPKLPWWYESVAYEYIQSIQAAASASYYLFSGPIDQRCRPFCLRHVGRAYTRPDIDRLDNGQLPNTFLSRGGYNCRHIWRPLAGTAYQSGAAVGDAARLRSRVRAASRPSPIKRVA